MLKALLLLMVSVSYAAPSYIWPTNASTTVTAVFGEMRPRRFHAGLDIRTWGLTGYEIYAVDSGYISRIRTSSKGYGKALYLQLDDGNTAVYAHLQSFTKTVDTYIRDIQLQQQSYTIDTYCKPSDFPVKKGEIIGHTGDTGTISGPHLHFEIRDKLERPVNPQAEGFIFPDTMLPVPVDLAIIPLTERSTVNTFGSPTILPIKQDSENSFFISDTIFVNGHAGIAADIEDRIDGQPYNFGIYEILLKFDGIIWYQVRYDDYAFSQDRNAIYHRDYFLESNYHQKYYRLFNPENHSFDNFIKKQSATALPDKAGIYNFSITAKDYSQNSIIIYGVIDLKPEDYLPEEQVKYELPDQILNQYPIESLSILQFEHGEIFIYHPELTVEKPHSEYTMLINNNSFPLTQYQEGNFISSVLPHNFTSPFSGIQISDNKDRTHIETAGLTAYPEMPYTLVSTDSLVTLRGERESYVDTCMVWINNQPYYQHPESGILISAVYNIGPTYSLYKNPVVLEFKINSDLCQNSGIYYFDEKKSSWYYMESSDSKDGLSTKILSGGIFSVIRDSDPPEISQIFPEEGAVYPAGLPDYCFFTVNDRLSGVADERDISVLLDGKQTVFEYNTYRKSVNYKPDEPLRAGKHTLIISVLDNAGNEKTVTRNFTVAH